ncbi:helix-turn-helix domain-containing protein [Paenactinomyces guangxiensis]|uniref:AraC family transcriptional regulator n=1 Tax=Paenactinomyces guangxiensis TaxID=1490290 RepID=A0A7W2A9P0_9BACL|nr:AraC family transcriptional regulator [Paenactinomyces guangxiensis]MBA4495078.1 AraC family transcriptional regulator [Paenactinomyces guangxiensis]MBH8592238.1 AraC family transcriptional regulator [Paenactinomyces guangxiensis]
MRKKEFAQLKQSSKVQGIELFHAKLFSHSFSKHIHEAYTIGIHDDGRGSFFYRGEYWQTHPGCLVILNPGEVHTGQANSETGWFYRDIYINIPLIEKVLDELHWQRKGLPFFTHPVINDTELWMVLSNLFFTLLNRSAILEQESQLLFAFAKLVTKHADKKYTLPSKGKETAAITRIRNYIEAHYAEEISINDLSSIAGLSPYYLIRSFKNQIGLPPHSYQRYLRILKAKQALHSTKSLIEVALENGFYDQSHFTRDFKGMFGVTPNQYRKSNFIQEK